MAREIRTDPAQSTGLRSKKNCGHGRDFFLDFYLYRTSQAKMDTHESGAVGIRIDENKAFRGVGDDSPRFTATALSREAQLLQDVRVTRVVAQALQIRVNL